MSSERRNAQTHLRPIYNVQYISCISRDSAFSLAWGIGIIRMPAALARVFAMSIMMFANSLLTIANGVTIFVGRYLSTRRTLKSLSKNDESSRKAILARGIADEGNFQFAPLDHVRYLAKARTSRA